MLQLTGIAAAILTTAAFLPQAIKTIKTRSTIDLSLTMFLLQVSGNVCWIIYGFVRQDPPLIFANAITGLLAAIILFFKITEKSRK